MAAGGGGAGAAPPYPPDIIRGALPMPAIGWSGWAALSNGATDCDSTPADNSVSAPDPAMNRSPLRRIDFARPAI